MSNKSGIAEQVISLSKGGGELNGIGETFSADLHTGTGNFSVPIGIPAGRNGFQPEINLGYSTGNGNSCYGLGWQINIPGVSRKTSKGIPRYYDGDLNKQDTFLLSGAEDLVPIGQSDPDLPPKWIKYKPRTEGLFAIISHYLDDDENDYWEVKTKDGLISYYGTPGRKGNDPAVIYDPNNVNKVFSWKLSETRDPFDSKILYEYERELGDLDNRYWNQLYCKRIRYLDYQDSNGDEQYLVSVLFEYEKERADSFSVYTSGFEIRTTRLCKKILTHTHPDGESVLVRSYDLVYEHAPLNQVALMKEVKVTGHDGDQEESLPPLAFSYTVFDPTGKDLHPVSGRDFPLHSLGREDTEVIDLDGNGLPDVVQMNGIVRYWKNLGKGEFDMPRSMQNAPAGINLADPNVQFMDANGEGRADLVISNNGMSGYFPTTFDGEWDKRSFRKHKLAPTFSLQDPEVKLVDLNGDGITDLLRSGSRMECYFNDPKEGWHDLIVKERKDLDVFPNVNLSDARVRLADMTGDGLQDIVLIHDGHVEYWPNMGYGNWGKRIHMSNSPRFPYGYDPKRILLGDISGDGPHDIIYVDYCEVLIWINQNGNGFRKVPIIDGTPPVTDMDAVRLMDLHGTGVSGILWSSDQRTNGRDHYFFLDLTGGIKPYVLNEMNNNMGAITKVEYRPSTFYYLQDAKNPNTRWKTSLPFPVQVVACVEVIDEISKNKLSTEYSYHHGHWDGAEREFRGFGRVEQQDTQAFDNYSSPGLHGEVIFHEVKEKFYTPPSLSKTWFHQGPVGEGEGDWEVLDYSNEYWKGDESKLDQFTDLSNFLAELPTRRQRRDAVRTLRGSVLRTELYALDGKIEDQASMIRQSKPYTVSESVFAIRLEKDTLVSLKGMSGSIFYPMTTAQRTTQWERGDDPMTKFSFSEAYDPVGIPIVQVAIACPRGWRNMGDRMSDTIPFLSTYSKSQLADYDTESPYIRGKIVKASSFEILHEGMQSLLEIKAAINVPDRLKLIAQSIIFYDGEAFEGLPFNEIGDYGIPVRTESLIIDEAILRETWLDENGNEGIPTYLNPDNPGNWPSEYPTTFQNSMPNLAGYIFYDGTNEHARGYWASGGTKFDFQDAVNPYAKGLPLEQKDSLGRISSIRYDGYHFMPEEAIDPLGMIVQAENNYRLFQPQLSLDPNNNVSTINFSPLGFVTATFLIGKEGKEEGDALDRNDLDTPGTRNEYDFFAFVSEGNPVYVKSIVREHHKYENDVPDDKKDDTITTIEYSDGFGRTVQTRTQAEDVLFGDPLMGNEILPEDQQSPRTTAPQEGTIRRPGKPMNVTVSGWQIYNNKGQVVQQYEPFYSKGFDYSDLFEVDLLVGQKVEQYYDPLGRVIQTLSPDGSEQSIIFGIPEDLNNPESYTPTPWEAYTYDSNDNAPRSGNKGQVQEVHWNTPSSIELDALGRTIKAIARNGQSPDEEFITFSTYDIRGNLLTVTDPLDRLAFHYSYDLTFDEENGSQVWRINTIDAGLRRIAFNVLGLEIERRDSKGSVSLQSYDESSRPIHFWARDKTNLPITLRQKLVYGDTLSPPVGGWLEEKDKNILGQLHQHYDEAGLVEIPSYDFKGNAPVGKRQVIKDEMLINLSGSTTFQQFQVDWENNLPADLLDRKVFKTSTTYDALNRPKSITYPEDVSGKRKVLLPKYNRAGVIESITFGDDEYVKHIAYNAKGQRTLIAYGNGLMTRYTYDDFRFWLNRLRTEKYDALQAENFVFTPFGGVQQDLGYEYDLIGNIITIKDHSPGAGIPNSPQGQEALDRIFDYDPLYRLISASGREHTSQMPNSTKPWLQSMTHTDQSVDTTHFYTRQYTYDKAGNMLKMKHIKPNGIGNFTRIFNSNSENNQLHNYEQGGNTIDLAYDPNGNMITENTSRHYKWNHADQLHSFRVQANGGSEPSLEGRYLYDKDGQRVKKIVWHQGGKITSTTYLGSIFEYHTETLAGTVKENNILHIMDDQSRIAMTRIGNTFDTNDDSPAVQYQLCDHLGNVHVVADAVGGKHKLEEHYPYGGTSFGGFAKKRYRFTGKERDEESGLNYHGARYYSSWTLRWTCADPAGMLGGINLFTYVDNNPIKYFDQVGTEKISFVDHDGYLVNIKGEYVSINNGNLSGPVGIDKSIYVGTFRSPGSNFMGFTLVDLQMQRQQDNRPTVGNPGPEPLPKPRRKTYLECLGQAFEIVVITPVRILMGPNEAGEGAKPSKSVWEEVKDIGIVVLSAGAPHLFTAGYRAVRGHRAYRKAKKAGEIQNGADLIESYLGKGYTRTESTAGEAIWISADKTKKVRFDIFHPHPHSSPHAHVVEYKRVKNKMVETAKSKKMSGPIYPTDVPHK